MEVLSLLHESDTMGGIGSGGHWINLSLMHKQDKAAM